MVEKHKLLRNTRDRISNFPDEVLTQILSFLSTKNVVRTSVLSKRWKPLWACVPTLDLSDSDFSPRGLSDTDISQRQRKFLAFIYEFLLQGDFSRITTFRLKCWGTYDEPLVRSWVDFAKKNNVQELSITTSFYEPSRRRGAFFINLCKVDSSLRDGVNLSYIGTLRLRTTDRFILDSWMRVVPEWNTIELDLSLTFCQRQELPPCLQFGMLVVLTLNSVFLNFSRASVLFPKLKVLRFRSVKFGNGGLASDLINSSCPVLEELQVLEELEMHENGMDNVQNLTIDSKTLKRLVMSHKIEEEFVAIIDAPNLRYLRVTGCAEEYVFKDLSLLEKAKLDFLYGDDCLRHVRMTNNVKYLRFPVMTMPSLNGVTMDLPVYKNLTCLNLSFWGGDVSISWDVMEAFLQKLPMLKDFIAPVLHLSSFELTSHHNVPSCLVYELETIKLDEFEPTDTNMRFVEYILKNSKVLKLMEFFLVVYDDKFKGDIRALPKASPACLIEFV